MSYGENGQTEGRTDIQDDRIKYSGEHLMIRPLLYIINYKLRVGFYVLDVSLIMTLQFSILGFLYSDQIQLFSALRSF